MGTATDAFIQETNQWKFLGASAWHACLFMFGAAVWHVAAPPWSQQFLSLFSFSAWFLTLLLYSSMLLVLYTQRKVLTTIDVPPLYVARLGWSGKSWASLFLTRCILRRRKLWDVVDVVMFYSACVLSACLGLYLLQPAGVDTGLHPLLCYGTVLGLMYGMGYLIRGKNVLSFPILQRHRYFRIKQRMRALAKSSLVLPSVALLPGLAAAALLAPTQPWGGPQAVLGLWRAGLLCVYGWGAGAHMLEVVFTERVVMASDDDAAPTAPLLEALQHKDPIVQDWCLMDLAAVAEGAAGCRGRRDAVFADETGASAWSPLARYCLTELHDFVGVMSGALPAVLGAANSGSSVRWNMLQLSAAGGRSASRAQDTALWHLQARYSRLAACMRILSGLAAAALKCDKYGVLQLSRPNLSDVLVAQLGVVAVLQAFLKHSSSIPSRPGSAAAHLLNQVMSSSSSSNGGGMQLHVDVATCALLDTAKTCTYRITNTYGDVLASVVGQAKPLVGSVSEAQALLSSFLTHQE